MHHGSTSNDYTSPSPYYQYAPNPIPNNNPNPIPDFHTSAPPSFASASASASAPPYSHYPNPNRPTDYPTNPYQPYPPVPDPQFPPHVASPQPSYYSSSHEPHPPPSTYAPPPAAPTPNPYPSSYRARYAGDGDGYGRSSSGLQQYPRGGGAYDDVFSDGVYAYDGGRSEPYGARGTAPRGTESGPSLSWSGLDDYGRSKSFSSLSVGREQFDDYGRSMSFSSSGREQGGGGGSARIVKAVPKAEVQQDAKGGVQKFRVKLLAETASQITMDILAQIGLDGIRMLDPSTNRTLRIYPLENVTRWEVLDSSIFAFWAKSPVDVEPKRIRLKSNSYTSNTILDIVTAAAFQVKEMGGVSRQTTGSVKPVEHQPEKKKGFLDWMNSMKPVNEEKDHWVPDEAVSNCTSCGADFGAFCRRHHCRNCGDIFCDKCTSGRIGLTADEQAQPVRVCDGCLAEVTQRLSRAKESVGKSAAIQSHEDLAKKLQAEMERNKKSSAGVKSSNGSGRRMREVACPICTVHLQVQVPSSGSETIQCGVCQQPFLISAH